MSTALHEPVIELPLEDDEALYEVVDGRREVKDAVGAYEVVLAYRLALFLESLPDASRHGRFCIEVMFDLRPSVDRHRRPDLAFVSYERWAREQPIPRTPTWAVVPDLAVEIMSPTNRHAAVRSKLREYFLAGVRRVWIVSPETAEIEDYSAPTSVRIVEAGQTLDAGELWPGVQLEVSRLLSLA